MERDADWQAIRKRIEALAKHDDGLNRPDLVNALGDGLLRLWKLAPNCEPSVVHGEVFSKIRRLMGSVPGSHSERTIRIHAGELSFNMSKFLRGVGGFSYTARRSLLDPEWRERNKQKKLPSVTLAISKSTLIRAADVVYDHLADQLHEQWQELAGGEPFPVDDDITASADNQPPVTTVMNPGSPQQQPRVRLGLWNRKSKVLAVICGVAAVTLAVWLIYKPASFNANAASEQDFGLQVITNPDNIRFGELKSGVSSGVDPGHRQGDHGVQFLCLW